MGEGTNTESAGISSLVIGMGAVLEQPWGDTLQGNYLSAHAVLDGDSGQAP